ncbi:MAG: hypothetical protein HS130_01045 [Deltaproteobacteria bacterium]|nr:hypothetical protein [Deltaproteobacteria bacterium]MCL4873827.1 hypothetical protein [bacterium]
MTHAEKRQELKKWLGVCKDRRERMIALRIFRARTRPPRPHTGGMSLIEMLLNNTLRPIIRPSGGDE